MSQLKPGKPRVPAASPLTAHNDQCGACRPHLANCDGIDAILHLLEEDVLILLHIVSLHSQHSWLAPWLNTSEGSRMSLAGLAG